MAKLIRVLIILAVLGGGAFLVYAKVVKKHEAKPGLTTIKVTRGDITEKALAVGEIQPRVKIQVKSKISGIVRRCFVEVGDHVKAGDPLFEVAPDPTPQELLNVDNRVRSAQASFDKAKADFERSATLYKRGLLPKSQLDASREAYELARLNLEQATADQELTRKGRVTEGATRVETVIRAPITGTVLSRDVDRGDPVVPLTSYQPGTQLASLADMHDLIFKGTVDEIDVGKIMVGMPCRIKVGALPDAIVKAHISRIAPQAKKSEGATLFDVEAELDKGTHIILRAGYSANANVIIKEVTNVLLIPERLVHFGDGGKKTTVEVPGKGPDAKPRTIAVKLGLSDGLNIQVLSGLKEGDEVIQRPPKEIS
ncbi:MAG: efflux RND transporter periplasmic adaptor subunit [Acidobacteria bacterium]|nr:efflux RND transporter periplasmic adaptor subunit [Acidobacteriota bacterium]